MLASHGQSPAFSLVLLISTESTKRPPEECNPQNLLAFWGQDSRLEPINPNTPVILAWLFEQSEEPAFVSGYLFQTLEDLTLVL